LVSFFFWTFSGKGEKKRIHEKKKDMARRRDAEPTQLRGVRKKISENCWNIQRGRIRATLKEQLHKLKTTNSKRNTETKC